MNLLMISLGNDVSLGKGERTIQRHLTYAEYSKINIYMILLSPIKNKKYKKLITRNNCLYIYPVITRNHLLLIFKALLKAIRICSKIDFDLIYSQDPFGTALIGNIVRRIFNIPLLIGNHSSFAKNKVWTNEKPLYFRFLKLIMRFNLPLADAWRVNNQKEKEYYIKYYGIKSNRIIVNHTLVDYETFTSKHDKKVLANFKLKITKDKSTKLLLWAGRPVKFKRIDLLIETFEKVVKEKPNTKLVLVGDFVSSDLFNNLIKKVDYNTKKNIYIFSKGADHSTLSKFYQVADLYLHTSSYEGFGVVLSEAALSGLPIVSTLSDGSRENVENGKSGYLVDSSSSIEIAKFIIKLLSDDRLRKEMSIYSKKRALIKYDKGQNLKTRDKMWKDVAKGGLNSSESL